MDAGFRIDDATIMKWKVSNDDFIPMTNRLRTTLFNRQKAVEGEYIFPG